MIDKLRLESVVEETGVRKLKIMCSGELQVDWKNLLDLQTVEDGRSLKKTDDDKITRLAESLIRFGIVNNLQVWFDKNNQNACFCFDAHHRVKAFAAMTEVGVEIPLLPATRCLAEDKTEARKMLLLKESTASWVDVEVVPDYLREIGFDIEVAAYTIDLPNFEWSDCEEIADQQKALDKKAEQIPDISNKIYIKKGDLIEMGNHRLLCGDSTKKEDVERLMDEEKADMLFTDPPYGIKRDKGFDGFGGFGKPIARRQYDNDWDKERPAKDCFDLILSRSDKAIIFGGNFFADLLPQGKHWLVWNKKNIMPTFGDCELAWTNIDRASIKLYEFEYNGLIGKEKERFHPTQKPIGLFEQIFNDYHFKTCFDPFLGSGTTLIAAQKIGRRCFGMEIDPHYCQVIVQRYVDFVENYEIFINGQLVDWRDITD